MKQLILAIMLLFAGEMAFGQVHKPVVLVRSPDSAIVNGVLVDATGQQYRTIPALEASKILTNDGTILKWDTVAVGGTAILTHDTTLAHHGDTLGVDTVHVIPTFWNVKNAAWAFTNKDFTAGSNTWPTFNQNTTGTASNITGILTYLHGGTGLSTLGSALQQLRVNAGGTALEWFTPSGGGGGGTTTNALTIGAELSPTGATTFDGSAAKTIGIQAGSVTNGMLAGSIAYSKLSLAGAILNSDLAGSIAYSKLSLTGAILNADLAGSIAYSKLSLTGAILNADLAGSIADGKLASYYLYADGTRPLSGNWDFGAFSHTYSKTGATAATVYDAYLARNTSTASSGNQMYSPATVWEGQGWKTTSTAASQSVKFRSYVVPVQGTTNPTGNLTFGVNVNSAGWTDNILNINSAGRVGINTSAPAVELDVTGQMQATTSALQAAPMICTNTNTGSGGYVWGSKNLTPNIISGSGTLVLFGKAEATNNSAYMAYVYSGSGSTSNKMTWSFYNNDNLMNLDALGKLTVGNATPAASAQFEVQSTTRGFLPPKMTTTQKNAISSPAEGLMVYDTTLHKLCVYTGSAWETITSM